MDDTNKPKIDSNKMNLSEIVRDHQGIVNPNQSHDLYNYSIERQLGLLDIVKSVLNEPQVNGEQLYGAASAIKMLEEEISKSKQLEDLTYESSTTNSVSGIPNDKAKIRYLENLKKDTPYYWLCFDIDDFGQFNKKYGQEVGDLVLKTTAETLSEVMRDYDKIFINKESKPEDNVYHPHGEEIDVIFPVILTEEKENELRGKSSSESEYESMKNTLIDKYATNTANRLRQAIEEKVIHPNRKKDGNIGLNVKVSGGLTRYYHENSEEAGQARDRADSCGLRYAKLNGKNQIHLVGTDWNSIEDNVTVLNPELYEVKYMEKPTSTDNNSGSYSHFSLNNKFQINESLID